MLEFERKERGDVTVYALHGQLDALSAPELKSEVDALVQSGANQLVFDLQDLNLIDSSGVGAIVSFYKRTRTQEGDVKIAGLNGQPSEIFQLLRLDKAFEIFPSVEDALTEV